MSDGLNKVVKAMFVDIDVDDALAVLKELKLPVAYSAESVAVVNAEADRLDAEAAKLKLAEAPRVKRKEAALRVNRMARARAFLYRLRAAAPGDVSVTVPPVGGTE